VALVVPVTTAVVAAVALAGEVPIALLAVGLGQPTRGRQSHRKLNPRLAHQLHEEVKVQGRA
jgi:hypothetical protein